jgi:hypothetical protein
MMQSDTTPSFDTVWTDLKRIYQVRSEQRPFFASRLAESDIQRWSTYLGIPRSALYDQIAIQLAHGFHKAELDFTFCDAIVNDLYRVIIFAEEAWPDVFWRVYLAFDEGEYDHKNNRDENPSEVYTRPQIADIVDKLPLDKSPQSPK